MCAEWVSTPLASTTGSILPMPPPFTRTAQVHPADALGLREHQQAVVQPEAAPQACSRCTAWRAPEDMLSSSGTARNRMFASPPPG